MRFEEEMFLCLTITTIVIIVVIAWPSFRKHKVPLTILCCCGILYITLLSRLGNVWNGGNSLQVFRFIYWVKIYYTAYGIKGIPWALGDTYLNILLFVPMGLLLSEFKTFKCGWIIVIGFGCSLCIELMQVLLHLGMFAIDDILMNTIGVGIGTVIYRKRMRNYTT